MFKDFCFDRGILLETKLEMIQGFSRATARNCVTLQATRTTFSFLARHEECDWKKTYELN